MGETQERQAYARQLLPFSILERIVMGETAGLFGDLHPAPLFQYPRTDRDG